MSTKYVIAGIMNEVALVADTVRANESFLSDKKNVKNAEWYPISVEMQGLEIEMLEDNITDADLNFLTADLTSLTIGKVVDDAMQRVYSEGQSVAMEGGNND